MPSKDLTDSDAYTGRFLTPVEDRVGRITGASSWTCVRERRKCVWVQCVLAYVEVVRTRARPTVSGKHDDDPLGYILHS